MSIRREYLRWTGFALWVGGMSFVVTGRSPVAMAAEPSRGKLTWSDEFNGEAGSLPDPSKWSIETGGGGWGNRELESYTKELLNNNLYKSKYMDYVLDSAKLPATPQCVT